MSIPLAVDGETDLDSTFFNQIIQNVNTVPLGSITGALGAYEPLANVATTDEPTKIGQALANTPDGRGWFEGAISADWFSDLNDAIDIARQGVRGVRPIVLSKDADYDRTGMDPIRLYSGVVIRGDSPGASRITRVDADSTVFQATPSPSGGRAPLCDRVVLSGFRVRGVSDGSGPSIGIDFRGVTRGFIDNVEVDGCADAQIWVGGDESAYDAGWSNTFERILVRAMAGSSGIRLSGKTDAGIVRANRNTFIAPRIYVANATDAIGFDLVAGDTNVILGGDIGYGTNGIAIKLGDDAIYNSFVGGACESINRSVRIEGGARNAFMSWYFAGGGSPGDTETCHPVELAAGSLHNAFVYCEISAAVVTPAIFDEGPANRTHIVGRDAQQMSAPLAVVVGSGTDAYTARRVGESYNRFGISESGALNWYDEMTGGLVARLRRTSAENRRMDWDDNTMVAIPRVTSLPAANATRRGATIRIEGGTGVADGVYICVKDAADAYSWKAVALA